MELEDRGRGINFLGYQGYVAISTIDKNGRKIKTFNSYNKGTPLLGNIICRSLLRDPLWTVSNSEKQYRIGLLNKAENGFGTNLLTKAIPFSGIVFGDAVNLPNELQNDRIIGQLKLTAILTRDAVNVGLNASKMELTINDQSGNVLAYIDDADISDDGESVLKNIYNALTVQDVLVEWYMLILNN